MDDPMVYYWRILENPDDRSGPWSEGETHHVEWIWAYFAQPVRDRPVTVYGQNPEDDEVPLECQAETNDTIVGRSGSHMYQILWCRQSRVRETLARYRIEE